eukprot:m.1420006 g.1420006  ORF g.1420006 m.1420006 type:complete len:856 (+) comp25044_c0_seq3:134-2701(+)
MEFDEACTLEHVTSAVSLVKKNGSTVCSKRSRTICSRVPCNRVSWEYIHVILLSTILEVASGSGDKEWYEERTTWYIVGGGVAFVIMSLLCMCWCMKTEKAVEEAKFHRAESQRRKLTEESTWPARPKNSLPRIFSAAADSPLRRGTPMASVFKGKRKIDGDLGLMQFDNPNAAAIPGLERHSANPLFLDDVREADPYRDPDEDDEVAPAAYFSPERYEAPAEGDGLIYAEGNPTAGATDQARSYEYNDATIAAYPVDDDEYDTNTGQAQDLFSTATGETDYEMQDTLLQRMTITTDSSGKVLRGPLYDQQGNAILTPTNTVKNSNAGASNADSEFAEEKRMLRQLQETQQTAPAPIIPPKAAPTPPRDRLPTPPRTPPPPPRRRSSAESRVRSPGPSNRNSAVSLGSAGGPASDLVPPPPPPRVSRPDDAPPPPPRAHRPQSVHNGPGRNASAKYYPTGHTSSEAPSNSFVKRKSSIVDKRKQDLEQERIAAEARALDAVAMRRIARENQEREAAERKAQLVKAHAQEQKKLLMERAKRDAEKERARERELEERRVREQKNKQLLLQQARDARQRQVQQQRALENAAKRRSQELQEKKQQLLQRALSANRQKRPVSASPYTPDLDDDDEFEQISPAAAEAANWTNKTITRLIAEIQRCAGGNEDDFGRPVVAFGKLFEETANIFDALSGILKTAKKYQVVDYDGEQLWQGKSDATEITLLQEEFSGIEIKRRPKSSLRSGPSRPSSTGFNQPSLMGEDNNCASCGSRVYMMDYVSASNKVFCKGCFRCEDCNRVMKSSDFCNTNDKFYCTACYRKLVCSCGVELVCGCSDLCMSGISCQCHDSSAYDLRQPTID